MTEYQVTSVRPPTPDEERLADWFAQQHLESPEHLEAAARQIVGLVTGLVGLLLGVAAVTEQPLPSYMTRPVLRWLTAVGIGLLLAALVAGLVVLWPRRMEVPARDLPAQREAFAAILQRKARALSAGVILFGLGVAALAAVLVLAVLDP